MEILEAFDLTRSYRAGAQLAGSDHKTVAHYVERRDAGYDPCRRARRSRLVDTYAEKIEELVDQGSGGRPGGERCARGRAALGGG